MYRWSVIFFILACLIITHAANGQDTLFWKAGKRLQWKDFEGRPDSSVKYAAATASGISWSYAIKPGVFSFTAQAYFAKKKSWRKEGGTSRMLQHEQGHFDITELFSRKLKAKVAGRHWPVAALPTKLSALVDSVLVEKDAMQRRYDVETQLGTFYAGQEKWLSWLTGELRKDR